MYCTVTKAAVAFHFLVSASAFQLSNRSGLNIHVLLRTTHHTGTIRTSQTVDTWALQANRCDQYALHRRAVSSKRSPVLGGLTSVLAYVNSVIVGLLSVLILRVFNKVQTHRISTLLDLVFYRAGNKGMLTVSNHQSVLDDPGIWGAVLPFWRLTSNQLRWVLCTEDVFFAKPWLTSVFELGNVLPLDRGGSIEQPTFYLFQEKLAQGAWCHIFPEGRVWQNWRFGQNEPVLGPFKHGVGKLIAHSYPNVPVVLPVYHKGMSNIIPEVQLQTSRTDTVDKTNIKLKRRKGKASTPISVIPRTGNQVEVFVGQPLDFTEDIRRFDAEHPGALSSWASTLESMQLYEQITEKIRAQMLVLEAEAYGRVPAVQNDVVMDISVDAVERAVATVHPPSVLGASSSV